MLADGCFEEPSRIQLFMAQMFPAPAKLLLGLLLKQGKDLDYSPVKS
jgi:hypothetical protein